VFHSRLVSSRLVVKHWPTRVRGNCDHEIQVTRPRYSIDFTALIWLTVTVIVSSSASASLIYDERCLSTSVKVPLRILDRNKLLFNIRMSLEHLLTLFCDLLSSTHVSWDYSISHILSIPLVVQLLLTGGRSRTQIFWWWEPYMHGIWLTERPRTKVLLRLNVWDNCRRLHWKVTNYGEHHSLV